MKIKDVGPGNYVVLKENIYNKLLEFQKITMEHDKEIPYFLYGKDKGNGIIYFEKISYNLDNLKINEADHRSMIPELEDKIYEYDLPEYANFGLFNKGPYERTYVCVGHTHNKGLTSDCFSLQDLVSAVAFKNCADFFKSDEIQILNMLLTPSGDFNFIKYESNPLFEGFYKYPNVIVRRNNGDLEKIPAYEKGEYNYMDDFVKKK